MQNNTHTNPTTTYAIYTYANELTDAQTAQLKVVYAKWKDVCTIDGDSMWSNFFTDNMVYTTDDVRVLAKYFNLATLLDDTTGIGATDAQAMLDMLGVTATLGYVALERDMLAIGNDKRALSNMAYMLHTGQAI